MKFRFFTIIFILGSGSMLSAKNTFSLLSSMSIGNASQVNILIYVIDTIPNSKVEINGKLKINNLPIGTGAEILADEEGNLVKRNLPEIPPFGSIDSLTYTVTAGPGIPLYSGTYNLGSSVSSGTVPGSGETVYNLSKDKDINSIGFINMVLTAPPSAVNLIIEIKFYKQGETTPYYAYKLTNISVLAYQEGFASGYSANQESLTLKPVIFGEKDYATGQSFAFNTSTMMEVAY